MDFPYDHVVEESLSNDRATTPTPARNTANASVDRPDPPRQSLQTEFEETFKAFSNSTWGAKLGGFWGNVRKQGESYYEEARKEAEAASNEAMKGFTGLRETIVSRTRSMSTSEKDLENEEIKQRSDVGSGESQSDAALRENETFIERFKSEAAKRLKEVQKAEDAADEALLRFGTNIRSFLRDAVSVAPPEETSQGGNSHEILFESKDPTSGKRVIHTSRFEAQLHVIHTNLLSFSEDPSGSGEEWAEFEKKFDIEKKTDTIASDLAKYEDLRTAMEKLVPEKVEYKAFWTRYYFLRHVVETREERRKELLKATANEPEEVGWDEDSDSDNENASSTTPQIQEPQTSVTNDPSSTLRHQPQLNSTAASASATTNLNPETIGRRSHDEKSVADSDASYDLVSGATSKTPSSPKDDPHHLQGNNASAKTKFRAEESDEEDWE